MDFRNYYIENILQCAKDNNLQEYTREKLDLLDQDRLTSLWDGLRWSYGDLSKRQ